MEVLITGANGFLGSALCRRLVGDGHRVRALVRPGSDGSALDGVGVERVPGGRDRRRGRCRRAVEGSEVVFHLAGLRRAPERSAFFRVNAEGTRTVSEAMLRVGARRMVLVGSLAAVGPSRPDRPHVETDPLEPAEWYGESKAEAERIALGTRGLEVAVARPPRILGPGDRENLVFFRLVKRGIRLEIGGGPRPLSVVDVDDVVELLVRARGAAGGGGRGLLRPRAGGHDPRGNPGAWARRAGGPATDSAALSRATSDLGGDGRRVQPADRTAPPAQSEIGAAAARPGVDLQR